MSSTTANLVISDAFTVPLEIQKAFYPLKRLTLQEFINFTKNHPLESHVSETPCADAFFSKKEPTHTAVTPMTLHSLRIPPSTIVNNVFSFSETAWKSGMCSIIYAHISMHGQNLCFPLWVSTFWKAMSMLHSNYISPWTNAITHLNMLRQMHLSRDQEFLITCTQNIFPLVCWLSPINGFSENVGNISDIARYCSWDWLSDTEISQMLQLLSSHLVTSNLNHSQHIHIALPFLLSKIHSLYVESSSNPGIYNAPCNAWVKEIGTKFEKGEKETLITVVLVDGNHWVGVVIEWSSKVIRYGDSLGHSCPNWIIKTIHWWQSHHYNHSFFSTSISINNLAVTSQTDSYSCGILAFNSILHFLFPKTFPLLKSDNIDWMRLDILIQVFEHHMAHAGALPSSDALWYIDSTVTAFNSSPRVVAEEDTRNEPATPLRKTGDFDESDVNSESDYLPINKSPSPNSNPKYTSQKHKMLSPPSSPQKKKKKRAFGKLRPKNSIKSFFPQNRELFRELESDNFPLSEIKENIPCSLDWEEVDEQPAGAGRPTETILPKVSVRLKRVVNAKTKEAARCIGCNHTWLGPRNRMCVLKHASTCGSLKSDLRRAASIAISNDSLTNKIQQHLEIHETVAQETKPSTEKLDINFFGEHGRKHQKLKLDHAILNLLCENSIPLNITRSRSWVELWNITVPNYRPASVTVIRDSHIPSQAHQIRQARNNLLQQEWNLSLSFDGGSIRLPQTVETIHVMTASHQTYLLVGHEASGTIHTAEHIVEVLLEAISEIGVERFAAITSDGAGNARKPRELITSKFPWILSFYDAAHATSLLCKDICRLPLFEPIIKDLWKILSYFKHSTFATTLLNKRQKERGIKHRLVSIGKTRFATIYYSGESLLQCLPIIKKLIADGEIQIDKAKRVFENAGYSIQFEFRLRILVMLLSPFARAIKCFESAKLTISDVYVFWLAITASVKTILDDSIDTLESQTIEDICEIVNYRYRNLIPAGNENPYVAAFYLDIVRVTAQSR